jgi:hypothetical protein
MYIHACITTLDRGVGEMPHEKDLLKNSKAERGEIQRAESFGRRSSLRLLGSDLLWRPLPHSSTGMVDTALCSMIGQKKTEGSRAASVTT